MRGEERVSGWDAAISYLLGTQTQLSDKVQDHRPLWDVGYAWGLGILRGFVSSS